MRRKQKQGERGGSAQRTAAAAATARTQQSIPLMACTRRAAKWRRARKRIEGKRNEKKKERLRRAQPAGAALGWLSIGRSGWLVAVQWSPFDAAAIVRHMQAAVVVFKPSCPGSRPWSSRWRRQTRRNASRPDSLDEQQTDRQREKHRHTKRSNQQ